MSVANKWPVVPLSTLAAATKGSIAGGPFGSDLVSRDYVASGVPVVRGVNLPSHVKFSFNDLVFVTENKADTLHLNCAHPGDLVFTQRGTLGQVGLLPKRSPYSRFLISQSQMKMTVDRKRADPLYLYYYFRLPSTVTYIENHALQSGVPHINLCILKKLQVICPSLNAQKKIAAILSAYDDLIENNRRRIALLEKMAEDIYREWFVRLRFPGHEQAKFEKGVPARWRELASSDVFDVLSGGTPKTDVAAYWDGEIPFFTPKDAGDNFYVLVTDKHITANGLNSCNSRLYPKETIFITARGTVGKLALANRAMAMNQSCYALAPKMAGPAFFHFMAIKGAINYLKGVSKSGVFDNIIVDTFKTVPILMPADDQIKHFNQVVGPMFHQVSRLMEVNALLAGTRDKFLPRLISGKLPVESLDIRFPPSMEEAAHEI